MMRFPSALSVVTLATVLMLCGCDKPRQSVPLSEQEINATVEVKKKAIERFDQPLMPNWYRRQLVPYAEIRTVEVETAKAIEIKEVAQLFVSSPFLGYAFYASNIIWILLLVFTPAGRNFIAAADLGSVELAKFLIAAVFVMIALASWLLWPVHSSVVRITPETMQSGTVVLWGIGLTSAAILLWYEPANLGKAIGVLLAFINLVAGAFALLFIAVAYIVTGGRETPWHYALSLGYIFLDTMALAAAGGHALARKVAARRESQLLHVSQNELSQANAKRLIGEIGSHFDLFLVAKDDQDKMVIEDNINQVIDRLSDGQRSLVDSNDEISEDIKDLLVMIDRNGWDNRRFAVRLKRRFGVKDRIAGKRDDVP